MSITIDNLVVQYKKQPQPALHIEHLEISEGIVAVIGENGAGKSTLFKTLQGFLPTNEGTIHKIGKTGKFSSVQVFQSEQCFEYASVKEWIEFQGLLRGVEVSASEIEACIEKAQLQGKEKHLVNELSGGQQRKLNLLCASFGDPDLLILDEPTTGLDQEARKAYWTTITAYRQSHPNTLLFSGHYMDEVEENADQVIVLSHGQVIATGSPEELVDNLGFEYVAIVPKQAVSLFDLQTIDYADEGECFNLYIADLDGFFSSYGSVDELIKKGIQLRLPNMSDVYTLHYREEVHHA